MIQSMDELSRRLMILDETTPLGIFLVKSDSTEEKLLFRFPYVVLDEPQQQFSQQYNQNHYALIIQNINDTNNQFAINHGNHHLRSNHHTNHHHHFATQQSQQSSSSTSTSTLLPAYTELTSSTISSDTNYDKNEITKIIGLTDSAFSNLFGAVKYKLCDQKFELKVDNVRFVGHPMLVDKHCFHIVFALKADAQHDIVNSYHQLSKHLAIILRSEEKRCKYFTKQSKIMISCHDELSVPSHIPQASSAAAAAAAACSSNDGGACNSNNVNNINDNHKQQQQSPYKLILDKCQLANELKEIFLQLCNDGIVSIKMNKWINLNFCLTQKVHRRLMETSPLSPPITPANIQLCLKKLRPYHTFLLLIEMENLLQSLPQDVSPSYVRLIRVSNPLKNLLELSADADITLSQVFNIVAELVYWGKATIIFPLCESNHYMLHPSASTALDSKFIKEFHQQFNGESLLRIMSKFSLGVSLSQFKNPMNTIDQESKFVRMIVWMLRKRLLLQLHMYVLFVPLSSSSSSSTSTSMNQLSSSTSTSTSSLIHSDVNHFNNNYYYYHPQQQQSAKTSLLSSDQLSLTSASDTCSIESKSPIQQSMNNPSISIRMMNIINEMNETSLSTNDSNHKSTATNNTNNNKTSEPQQSTSTTAINDQQPQQQTSELLLKSIKLNDNEIKQILSVPAAENLDDIRLFIKLLPYFNGHHHIEDIMYYENLRRSNILTLIDKFRDVLIVCQYEDTTVAELLPYNTLQ